MSAIVEGVKVSGGCRFDCRSQLDQQEVEWRPETQTVTGNGNRWKPTGMHYMLILFRRIRQHSKCTLRT